MNDTDRYRGQELYYRHADVTVYRGTDPLTGLPVLVYEFPAAPEAGATALESEHIPGVLAASFDGTLGRLVTAYSPRYALVAPGESTVDDAFALAFARALLDAHTAGVVHGDLRPGRLLFDRDHLLVEGYGVPWASLRRDQRTPERATRAISSDVLAWAATLEALGTVGLGPRTKEMLAAAHDPVPSARPSPGELHEALAAARRGVVSAPSAQQRLGAVMAPSRTFDELTLPIAGGSTEFASGEQGFDDGLELIDDAYVFPTSVPPTGEQTDPVIELYDEPFIPGPGLAGAPSQPSESYKDEPEPITVTSDPGLVTPTKTDATRQSGSGFVRDLPPGVTYRAGSLDATVQAAPIRLDRHEEARPPRRAWRAPLLFIVVLLVVGALFALVFVNRGEHVPTPVSRGAVNYIVDVHVSPSGLPPVTLVVVTSPPGSSTPAGTILGNAPRKVLLDREGDWVLRGEFQDRRSEPATLHLPDERQVTIVFPDTTSPQDRDR